MILARRLFLATRPMFFPASVLPVAVGSAFGAQGPGGLDWAIAVAAAAAMICLHGGANVLNDVADEINGCDRANTDRIAPFTGGSRFLQDGLLSLRQMTGLGTILLAVAVVIGLGIAGIKGPTVLVLGALGGALGLAYSLKPLALASRGWGEAVVAVAFGLPVAASAWIQHGGITPACLCAASAIGALSAAILIANEVPDIKADAGAGKRTLVVRLGPSGTRWLYAAVQGVAVAFLCASAWMSGHSALTTLTTLAPLMLTALIIPTARRLTGDRAALTQAIRATLTLHLAGGIYLLVVALS